MNYHELFKLYSSVLDKQTASAIASAAVDRANFGRSLGLPIEAEDVASSLYTYCAGRKVPAGKLKAILIGQGTEIVFAEQNQRNGYIYGVDNLVHDLTVWGRTGFIMKTLEDALYGARFKNAGLPAGSYFEIVYQTFHSGRMPKGNSAEGKKLTRAINRLAEIVSEVMVGNGGRVSFETVEGELTLEEVYLEYEDVERQVHESWWICEAGHRRLLQTAVSPNLFPNKGRLGTRTHGYRHCCCGRELHLDTTE